LLRKTRKRFPSGMRVEEWYGTFTGRSGRNTRYPCWQNLDERTPDSMLDQITDFLSDLPISLIIFGIALLFGVFGRDDKKQQQETAPRESDIAPPEEPSTYGADERRYGNTMFEDQPESAFKFGEDDEAFRDRTQWGQTKFGFDANEWGSTFDESDDQWGGTFD